MTDRAVTAREALECMRRSERLLAELAPAMIEFATGLSNVAKAVAQAGEGLEHVLRAARKLDSRDAPEAAEETPHNHTGWGARPDCPRCQTIWGDVDLRVETPQG